VAPAGAAAERSRAEAAALQSLHHHRLVEAASLRHLKRHLKCHLKHHLKR